MAAEGTKKHRERMNHLERVFWIDHEIRALRYPTARTIAEQFEISSKTAQRTLDFMRDRLHLPLAYSAERKGWYYTEPTFGLPAIELSEGDLVAILLSERLAREYRGLAIGRQVEQTFAKVLSCMTNIVSIDFESLIEAHSFEANATVEVDPEVFRRLGRAAIERRRIQMTYYTAARGEVAWRLDEMGIKGEPELGPRRYARIGRRTAAGFALKIHDLGEEGSLLLQEQGMGNWRYAGCGYFVPGTNRADFSCVDRRVLMVKRNRPYAR